MLGFWLIPGADGLFNMGARDGTQFRMFVGVVFANELSSYLTTLIFLFYKVVDETQDCVCAHMLSMNCTTELHPWFIYFPMITMPFYIVFNLC